MSITSQSKKIAEAIRMLEKACLAAECKLTTATKVQSLPLSETREYFYWLRQQAPMTAMMIDDFDTLTASV